VLKEEEGAGKVCKETKKEGENRNRKRSKGIKREDEINWRKMEKKNRDEFIYLFVYLLMVYLMMLSTDQISQHSVG
jgi:hypothetical protein